MLVTGTVTVTSQVADTLPALAVITALPPPTAVTLPLWSTVATSVLLLFHTMVSVLSLGLTVAARVSDLPFSREREVLSRVISVAGFSSSVTVTLNSAVSVPAVAVIVVVPAFTPRTLPSTTFATASSAEV